MQNVKRKSVLIIAMAVLVLSVMTAILPFSITNAWAMVEENRDNSAATSDEKEDLTKVKKRKLPLRSRLVPDIVSRGGILTAIVPLK